MILASWKHNNIIYNRVVSVCRPVDSRRNESKLDMDCRFVVEKLIDSAWGPLSQWLSTAISNRLAYAGEVILVSQMYRPI